jgi:hypothetical protein
LHKVTAIRDTSSRPGELATNDADLGAEGNERLTAWTGAALLLGFAAEGLTLLDVRWYMTWHLLIGYALLVPIALKLASTIYRFGRYYTHAPAYRRKGPPRLLLRVIGPVLVLATVTVMLSGIGLMFSDTYHRQLEELHKLSFVGWVALTAIHVLAYLWRLPRLMLADVLGRGTPRSAAVQRIVLSVGSGVVGLGLGLALLPWINDWIAR